MRTLFQLIRLQRNDWIVTSFVFLRRSLLTVESLIIRLTVVLASLLALKSLLHPDDSLLAQRLGWILHRKLLTFFSTEVVRDEVICNFHIVEMLKLFINTLLSNASLFVRLERVGVRN